VTDANPRGDGWIRVPGRLARVSAGVQSVWGVNLNGGVFCRTGIATDRPRGTGWIQVPGRLAMVCAGEPGVVWGLNDAGGVFVRSGIDAGTPEGTGWQKVPGTFDYIAAGIGSVWAVAPDGSIHCRLGVSGSTPAGTEWSGVWGMLQKVTAGEMGIMWGLNAVGGIFARMGVTESNPRGTHWDRVWGRLAQASAGFDLAWGVNAAGGIWYRAGMSEADPIGSGWQRVPGTLRQVALGTAQTLAEAQSAAKNRAPGSEDGSVVQAVIPAETGEAGRRGLSADEDAETAGSADTQPPGVAVLYPAPGVRLEDGLITVRGTASDAGLVRGVWVNGVRAVPTGPNYATWQATVPLSQGRTADDTDALNMLVVGAADEAGNYAETSVTVLSVGEAGRVRKVGLDTIYRGCLVEGDVDTFQFGATAGTALEVILEGAGTLELRDPWGEVVELDGENMALAATGLYTLRVLPEGEGSYELSVKGTVPRSVVRRGATLAGASDEAAYAVASVAGGVLSARAVGELGPAHLAVLDPAGRTVAEADGLLRGLPLPLTGDYAHRRLHGRGERGDRAL